MSRDPYQGFGAGAGNGSPWPTAPGSHVYIFFLSLIFKIIFVDYYKKRAFLYKSLEKKLFTYILVGKEPEPGAVKSTKITRLRNTCASTILAPYTASQICIIFGKMLLHNLKKT